MKDAIEHLVVFFCGVSAFAFKYELPKMHFKISEKIENMFHVMCMENHVFPGYA